MTIELSNRTMKAAMCTKYGGPDVLKYMDAQKPTPKPDEVLVKIHAAAATTASITGRKGTPHFIRLFFGLTKPRQPILGQEIAGGIVAIGQNVKRFNVGDKVFGMTGTQLGAYAEYICLKEQSALTTMPANATFAEAVAIVEGGLTALNFLLHSAEIKPHQNVLIYGASGSVGTASVQVAKQFDAHVTGVCSGRNIELVTSLGADETIDYTQDDFTTNGQRYDIIFDTVGKLSFKKCRGSLTENGIYLDAGGMATLLPMLWTSVFGNKKAILAMTYVRSADKNLADLERLKQLFEDKNITAVIDRTYQLSDIADAYRYVETGRKRGNVILDIRDND